MEREQCQFLILDRSERDNGEEREQEQQTESI